MSTILRSKRTGLLRDSDIEATGSSTRPNEKVKRTAPKAEIRQELTRFASSARLPRVSISFSALHALIFLALCFAFIFRRAPKCRRP